MRPVIVNLLLNGRDRLDPAIEHHCQLVADVRAGERRKAPSTFAREGEVHVRAAIFVGTGIGRAQIAAAYRRGAADQPVGFAVAALVLPVRAASAFHQHRIGRKHAIIGLHRSLFAGDKGR